MCAVGVRLSDVTGTPSRYTDGQNIRWHLVAFSDHDERLCDEYPIPREQFLRGRGLFDYGDDEWFANSYEVRSELWPQVIEILSCPPPEPGKTCFIQGTATDS